MNPDLETIGRPTWPKKAVVVGSLMLAGCASSATPATTTATATSAVSIAPPTSSAAPPTPAPTTAPASTTALLTTAPATTPAPTPPPTTATPSDADAAAAGAIEFYRAVLRCYGPAGCDFSDIEQYFAPGSPAVERFRAPLDRFRADQLMMTNGDEVLFRVDRVDLQPEEDGQARSGTVVLCQRDDTRVVNSTGSVVDDDVVIKRLTVVVVKIEGLWKIAETTAEPLDPGDPACAF